MVLGKNDRNSSGISTDLTWQPAPAALGVWDISVHLKSRANFKCDGIKSSHYKQKIYYKNSMR